MLMRIIKMLRFFWLKLLKTSMVLANAFLAKKVLRSLSCFKPPIVIQSQHCNKHLCFSLSLSLSLSLYIYIYIYKYNIYLIYTFLFLSHIILNLV